MRAPTRALVSAGIAALVAISACANTNSYRLSDTGREWRSHDIEARYPDFFAVVLDPSQSEDPPILDLREDIEDGNGGRKRYDALNAVAIAYFEFNSRAQRGLEDERAGSNYFTDSFRATKLLSIPWRAYADIEDPKLRDAILDFYADIARGGKRDAETTAPRITRLVQSLEKKESDPTRLARIREMAAGLEAMEAEAEAAREREEF